jgi:hypothetical protein
MKKIFFILIMMSTLITPQEKTLIGTEITHGGFGAPVVKFTNIDGVFGVLVGGRGGWIINNTFVIGGGGYGLANPVDGKTLYKGEIPYLNFGYGGFELEYIINSDELLHFSAYSLIGGGGVSYRNKFDSRDGWEWDHMLNTFFVFEPALNAELNVARFMRMNVGLSYRFISGVRFENYKNSDLSGPSINLTFKFGKF